MIFMKHTIPMRWAAAGIALAAVAWFCTPHASAQQTNSDNSMPSIDSFRIISQRNIFDPNRSPRIRPNVSRQNTRQGRTVDAFSLVGTMSYEKGKFAFFDGTGPQYKKVLQPGGNIAGYTVKDVTAKNVTLAANGKEFEMKVGTQLRNEGENSWQVSTQKDLPTNADHNGESAALEAPPAGSSPQMNDVLKRLMQQREQELK
jgi:hypothetical protein